MGHTAHGTSDSLEIGHVDMEFRVENRGVGRAGGQLALGQCASNFGNKPRAPHLVLSMNPMG